MVNLKLMNENCRLFIFNVILLSLLPGYVSGIRIVQGPTNATVLSGTNVSFTCIVSSGWQSLSWNYKSISVVNIRPDSGTVVGNDQIVTRNSTNTVNGDFTSEITIINVKMDNSGEVVCSPLSAESKNAFLSVQVNGSLQITNGSVTVTSNKTISIVCKASGWYPSPVIAWQINDTYASKLDYVTDYSIGNGDLQDALSTLKISPYDNVSLTCLASIGSLVKPQSATVTLVVKEYTGVSPKNNTEIIIIAVTVSVAVLLLLVAVTVIVICCQRKKRTDTSYQSEKWKVSARSAGDLHNTENKSNGINNYGYLPEASTSSRPLPSIPSDFSTADTNSIIDTRYISDIYDTEFQVSEHIPSTSLSRKTRHLTHV